VRWALRSGYQVVSEKAGLLRPRKRFGQHFLYDVGAIQRIVDSLALSTNDVLVEIGPGRGALTDQLVRWSNPLHLIEIDRDLVPYLSSRYKDHVHVVIHERDALQLTLDDIRPDQRKVLVGNLPYNISTPLLIHLLSQHEQIERMIFMVQKEVGERLAAQPGTKNYGRLTVMMTRLFETTSLFDVGPEAFNPPPKVWSSVLAFRPRPTPLGPEVNEQDFEALVRQAFAQRRKTLRNTLKERCSEAVIREAGIDPGARPETLSPEDFARLCALLPKED
jgi:16S rRNA (adenine1518-N6/adenine1519-N6)-dimethyltransferase